MSEQEKKIGSHSGGAAPVVVEQTTSSRHKQPYRQEEAPDLLHKRSTAPAVPSVTEDLKNVSKDTPVSDSVETKERKEIDNEVSSDKYRKHDVAKKLSSSAKRREPTGECITLATMEVDVRKGTLTPPPQPIPAAVKTPSTSDLKVPENESIEIKNEETHSLTEEISELRTADAKYSEWEDGIIVQNDQKGIGISNASDVNVINEQTEFDMVKDKNMMDCNSHNINNREVSWETEDYLQKVQLKEGGAKSNAVLLERKASVGPYRSRTSNVPSGIMICVPKKSTRKLSPDKSGINITISKRNVTKQIDTTCEAGTGTTDKRAVRVDPDIPYLRILGVMRDKYNVMRSKIKNVMHT